MIRYLVLLAIFTTGVGIVRAADQNSRFVIYDGVATQVSESPNSSNDLWITTNDLARATRFVIKPQGVCRDELCFPAFGGAQHQRRPSRVPCRNPL